MTSITKTQVRYAETDQMGVVHHAAYFVWMELGRTNLMKEAGYSYKELEERGIILPVAKAFAKYVASSYYDDEVSIHSTVTNISGPKLRIDYKIYRNNQELICAGFTEHAFIERKTGKMVRGSDIMEPKIFLPEHPEEYMTKI